MASKKKRGAAGKKAKKKAVRKKASARKAPARKKAARKTAKKAAKKAARKKSARKKTVSKRPAARASARRRSVDRPRGKARKKAKRPAARVRASRTARRPTSRVKAARGREFQAHFRQRLLDQRQEITDRLGALREELSGLEQTPPRELEEWAQEEKDRDILIRLEERETDELRRIQAALALIDAGEYGVCQNCGKPIPRARLEELPTAFRCIDCTP